jgi:crossover junction endodeoxyribonuclease RuvC
MMRVLGIDPGYDRLGVSVLEYKDGKEVVLYSTCIESNKADDFAERILFIGDAFLRILDEYQPTSVAIETLFFNKNVKTAMGVAQARGALLYLAKSVGCEIYEFSPQQIKSAVTGYGNSDKQAVIAMVSRLVVNVPTKAHDDEYDAIAVAVTCLASYGRNR